jgi:hypothetical protein
VRAAAPQVVETVLFALRGHLDWQEPTRGPVRISVQVGDEIVENPGACYDHLPGELVTVGGWLARFATKPIPQHDQT